MTGLLRNKYNIAVLGNSRDNDGLVSQIVSVLNKLYNHRIVINTYQDSYTLFEAVGVGNAKNKPVDLAVLTPGNDAEQMILKQSNPNLKVIICKDTSTLKDEASKAML